VPIDELVEDLWRGSAPRTVVKSLQTQLTYLRQRLAGEAAAPTLINRSGGYSLQVDDASLDAWVFERSVRDASRALAEGSPDRAGPILHEALALWRGRALLDVEDEPFAQREIARLEQLRLTALEERFAADLALGAHRQVVSDLEAFVRANGLRERAWGQLMIAYYRGGRQADALRAYQRAASELADIGIEPTPELRSLERAVLDQADTLEWRSATTGAPPVAPAARSSAGRATASTLPLPAAAQVRAGVFGRSAELASIRAAWQRSSTVGRTVVLVEGDPGIGKTRLVAEAAAEVARARGMVLWGRCDENLTNPYQPFSEVLEQIFRWASDDQVMELAGPSPEYLVPVVPFLAERIGAVDSPRPHGSDYDRFLVFDAVSGVLGRLLDHGPMLVVIDDLHWAAPPTLLLLRHWLNRASRDAAMLIATYRPGEVDDGAHQRSLLADLNRDPDTSTIVLDDLPVEDLEDLVREAGRVADVGDVADFARLLHARAGGNPLLSTQLLRYFVEATPRRRDELRAGERSNGSGPVAMPASISRVIRDRVDRLDHDVVRALQIAAVIGVEFDLATLERFFELESSGDRRSTIGSGAPFDVLPAVEAATAARLLDETSGGCRFRFVHALVRDSIYRDLSGSRRARVHHRIAEVLVELGSRAPIIAHHYELAVADGAQRDAIEWLERAARDHKGGFAHDDARHVLERALTLVNATTPIDRDERGRIGLALAECAEIVGDREASKRHAEQAARDAKSSGSIETFAYAAVQRAGYAQPDLYDEVAAALVAEAIDMVGERRPELRALLLSRAALSQTTTYGPTKETSTMMLEAIALAREAGDREILYEALAGYCHIGQSSIELSEQRSVLAEMAAIEQSHDFDIDGAGGRLRLPFQTLARLRYEAVACLRAGDLQGFDRFLADLEDQGRRGSDWLLLALAAANRALRALLDGRFAEVGGHIDELGRLGGHDVNVLNWMMALRFRLARELGDVGALEAILTEAEPRPAHVSMAVAAFATLLADAGETDEAHRVVTEFLPECIRDLSLSLSAPILGVFAQACCDAHDTDRAAQFYEELSPYSGEMLVFSWAHQVMEAADHYLGILAAELGHDDEADERFAAALRLEQSLPSPPLAVRTMARWGESLLQRSTPDDRRRGEALLAEAEAEATRLGMTMLARHVAAAREAQPTDVSHIEAV
jgi:DNA-binding SARP family transcriptional activator